MALFAGGLGLAAHALRRRLLPEWDGPPAWLGDVVVALGGAIGVGAVLGAVGLLERWALLLAAVLAGAAGLKNRGRPTFAKRVAGPATPPAWIAFATTAVVVANWTARSYEAVRHGMPGVDTLWYHMPFAARLAQDGSIHSLAHTQPESLTLFYPLNAEVLHAIGIVLTGYDVVSPLLNLAWLAVALLAAWCVGRPFGVSPLTLIAANVVLGCWLMTWSQAGEASNDITGVALLFAAVALLVHAEGDRRVFGLAALPAALAMGTKVSLVAGVAALFVAVGVTAPERSRRTVIGTWLLVLAAVGGFWYWRNLIAVGNPVPGVGALGLPEIDADPALQSPPTGFDSTLAHLVTEEGARQTITGGLRTDLGPAWWAVVAVAGFGLAAAALNRGRRGVVRALGITGIVIAAVYVVTPQSGVNFPLNVRYAIPALALGLMLVPIATGRRVAALVVLAALFVTAQLADDVRPGGFALAWWGVLAAAALLVPIAGRPRAWAPTAALALVVAIAGGYALQRDYLDNRYADPARGLVSGADDAPLRVVFAWARDLEDQRIALYGTQLQYPLFGRNVSNRVRYVHDAGDHGRVVDRIRTCDEWGAAVAASGARYVVVTPVRFPFNEDKGEPPEARWTRALPGAQPLGAFEGQVFVFEIAPRPRRRDALPCRP